MEKRKININRPKVSSEEIGQHMDFGSVLGGHAALTTPWYKTTGFIASAVGTVAVVTGVVLYMVLGGDPAVDPHTDTNAPVAQDFTYQYAEDDNLIKPAFLNRPFEDVQQERTRFTVIAEEGGNLNYHTGTRIVVPKGAFLNENGDVVDGEVEIQYIEYHDQAEIFMSGIPMTYDSAGTTYHFESAGMLEIYAFQNGEVLKTNPEKAIQIEMKSRQEGSHFNIYRYDEVANNWVYKGKDQVTPLPLDDDGNLLASHDSIGFDVDNGSITNNIDPIAENNYQPVPLQELATPAERARLDVLEGEMVKLKDEIADLKKEEPQKPVKADRQRNRFNLDYNVDEFPELEVYQNTMFELGDDEENKDFSTDLYQIEWEDMKLSEHRKGISYRLTLIKGTTEKSFVVYPVFEGGDHDAAMKQYQQKFSEYQSKLDLRLEAEAKKKEEYEQLRQKLQEEQTRRELEWNAEMERKKEEWHAQQEQMQAELDAQLELSRKIAKKKNKVMRAFTISNFGVWNSDHPQGLPQGAMVSAHFADKDGNELSLGQVYLVQKDVNALFNYWSSDFGAFSFDPEAENLIWAVTADNKLAIVSADAFKNVPSNQKHTFVMTLIDQKFRTTSEVREFLDI